MQYDIKWIMFHVHLGKRRNPLLFREIPQFSAASAHNCIPPIVCGSSAVSRDELNEKDLPLLGNMRRGASYPL